MPIHDQSGRITGSGHDLEFEFTARDFSRVRDMIYQRAGIALGEQKQELVYGRLSRRLRALGFTRFSAYLDLLERKPSDEEWINFTNALTTNLTSFFREAHHFPMLAEFLLTRQSPVNIWCAGSSTGEETWSIVMTACEAFDSFNPPVTVLASDIDTQVLKTAERGVYPVERVQKLAPERLRRFFLKGNGGQHGFVRIKPALQQLVQFRAFNLLAESWPDFGEFDAVFCRNVMIYFDKNTQGKLLAHFSRVMKPQGLLFAGHSENFLGMTSDFVLMGKTVYRLKGDEASRQRAESGRL